MMLQDLNRANLADQIAERLLFYIDSKNLKPGDKLPSNAEISETFGVSRAVVREAFKLLEAKYIIEVVNGKRATVKPVSSDLLYDFFQRMVKSKQGSLRSLLEVREGIEVQNVRLAALRRTPEQLEHFHELISQMRGHVFNHRRYIEFDMQLHILIAQATHNMLAENLIESIRQTMQLTMISARVLQLMDDRQVVERIHELHEGIVQEIERADPEAAANAMYQHFEEMYRNFKVDSL